MLANPSLAMAEAMDARRFHLILFPTEQCNFRCVYCYEDFAVGTMRPEVVAGVKALLSRRAPQLDALQLSWFGGEPLIATDVIYDISRHVLALSKQNKNLLLTGNITTNGSLLDIATFRDLTSFSIQLFQISLDGHEELHNRSRVALGGQGTFQRIWSNLLAIRNVSDSDTKATIVLRVHYSPDTWLELLPLIDVINSEFGDDDRFQVYFKSIERLGSKNDGSIRTFTEKAKREVEGQLAARLVRPGMSYRLAPNGPYVCYASKANSLAVRATGEINKCTVALSDPRNNIGRVREDGSLLINNDRLRPWLRGLETLDPAMLACPYGQIGNNIKPDSVREELSSQNHVHLPAGLG